MIYLALGVLLWAMVHFIPVFLPGPRARVISAMGEGPYKGVFALAIAASIGIIVYGWRHTDPVLLYQLPGFVRHLMMLLVFLAIVLFAAAKSRSRIRLLIRHPMLTGVLVWAGAHLLVNGDSRSLILFGGLGLWALISIFGINARDGARQSPGAPWSWGREAVMLVGAVLVTGLLIFLHPWFTGMPVI
ncbi:MAG: NnrU protein [Hyphomicrobiales bacterium]|nr:MAG: NnrU protein [Hyphomicrobiales bacterium]